jgi:hypothetical protein
LEPVTEKPLIRVGISTFTSILNALNSLRNQSDQPSSLPIDLLALSLLPSPNHYYHWIPLQFYSRLSTCLHTFDDLYFHSASVHLPPLCPFLSVSWLP